MKIIALLPVKNDAWFIENSIRSLCYWADEVLVFDESSTDGSDLIYKKLHFLNNLTVITDRPKFSFTTPDLRNYMLNQARNFDGNNLIVELHADEIMSAEILQAKVKDAIKNEMKPKDALMLNWTTLWKRPDLYRNDKSVWSNNRCWFGYVDDRKCKFTGPVFHGPRAPEEFLKNKKTFDQLEVLHYQFLNLGYERSKQALYQIFERNHYPEKSVEQINKNYAIAFDERGMKLSKLDNSKISPWLDLGLPLLATYDESDVNWRDIEILKNFERYGVDKYKEINIWYVDWNRKRKSLIEDGLWKGEAQLISDPRGLSTKLAHKWVMKTQSYPFWRVGVFMLFIEKIIQAVSRKLNTNAN